MTQQDKALAISIFFPILFLLLMAFLSRTPTPLDDRPVFIDEYPY